MSFKTITVRDIGFVDDIPPETDLNFSSGQFAEVCYMIRMYKGDKIPVIRYLGLRNNESGQLYFNLQWETK